MNKILFFLILLLSVSEVLSEDIFEIEFKKVHRDNACLKWAKAYISQCDPTSVMIYDNPTKCRVLSFKLKKENKTTFFYLEILNNQGYTEGRLFENSGFADCFAFRADNRAFSYMGFVFEKTGFIPVNEEQNIEKQYVKLTKNKSSLKNTSDLLELVGILREKHKDKFLEVMIDKDKFSDVPEEYKKAVIGKIREYIIEHDMKSEKVLEALGTPLPEKLEIKIMPFVESNNIFYYMYENTKDRVLRKAVSDADGGFFPESETTAVGEAHNVEIIWVDKPYTEDGPAEYEIAEKFYKTLEKDGIKIIIDTKELKK